MSFHCDDSRPADGVQKCGGGDAEGRQAGVHRHHGHPHGGGGVHREDRPDGEYHHDKKGGLMANVIKLSL